jgi:hypothetical protein
MRDGINFCSITVREGDSFCFDQYRINGYAILPCKILGVNCDGFVDAIKSGENCSLISDVHERLHDALQDKNAPDITNINSYRYEYSLNWR